MLDILVIHFSMSEIYGSAVWWCLLFVQICAGKVTTLHLYQGAFVDIGGVYDGYVSIQSMV